MYDRSLRKKVEFIDGGYADIFVTDKSVDAKSPEDMKKICADLNFNYDKFTDCIQIHSDKIVDVKNENTGQREEADALITVVKDVPLAIYTADCVPIVIVDRRKKVVADIHAGWRGTHAKITTKTVDKMVSEYGCSTEDMFCFIGPSIGRCCYEVSEELINKFNTIITKENLKFYIIEKERYYLDLWEINKYFLKETGISDENIECCNLCTSCNNDRFFSYRKDNKTEKRIGTMVQIKF